MTKDIWRPSYIQAITSGTNFKVTIILIQTTFILVAGIIANCVQELTSMTKRFYCVHFALEFAIARDV